MATSVEARKAVERPCAREARHHDNPSLEPGCAVRKITFLKQPREMGLLMIKQLSSDYYVLKLELPCIMLEDRIWGSRTGKLLIQIRTGIKILDSCLSHVFSDAFVLTWTIRDRACITINWTLGTTKCTWKWIRTKADSPVTASSDVLEKEVLVHIWSQSFSRICSRNHLIYELWNLHIIGNSNRPNLECLE